MHNARASFDKSEPDKLEPVLPLTRNIFAQCKLDEMRHDVGYERIIKESDKGEKEKKGNGETTEYGIQACVNFREAFRKWNRVTIAETIERDQARERDAKGNAGHAECSKCVALAAREEFYRAGCNQRGWKVKRFDILRR